MKRTILFINGHLEAGGCERSLTDVLKNINYDKYEVDLLLLERRGDYLEEIPQEVNIKLYSLDNAFGSLIPCLKQAIKRRDWFSFSFRIEYMLGKKVNRFFLGKVKRLFGDLRDRYDVISAYRPGICTELAAFTFKGKKKITWWHHGIMNFSGIALEELHRSYQKMDCVVAVSESSMALLTENFPDMKEKFIVIPNMIVSHELSLKAKMYEAVEFQNTVFKIVTVGRLSAEKNMRLCPEVAAALKNKGINFKWVLIGDGEEKRHISNMIAKYNLGENVIMLGTNKNPYPYIATADVMIHPSLVESQGITILESMVLETPVIAVNSAGPREFIISGINGYLVVPEVDKIVKLIEKIYKDPELREKMVENARETVRRFEPQYIIKQIEEILET